MATLIEISAQMKLQASLMGQSKREVRHGLKLSLSQSSEGQTDTIWRMILSRQDSLPSVKEEETIRREFGIPASAKRYVEHFEIRLLWTSDLPPLVEAA